MVTESEGWLKQEVLTKTKGESIVLFRKAMLVELSGYSWTIIQLCITRYFLAGLKFCLCQEYAEQQAGTSSHMNNTLQEFTKSLDFRV